MLPTPLINGNKCLGMSISIYRIGIGYLNILFAWLENIFTVKCCPEYMNVEIELFVLLLAAKVINKIPSTLLRQP